MALMLETDPSEMLNEILTCVRKAGRVSIVSLTCCVHVQVAQLPYKHACRCPLQPAIKLFITVTGNPQKHGSVEHVDGHLSHDQLYPMSQGCINIETDGQIILHQMQL